MPLAVVPKTYTFDQWRQAYNELIGEHNLLPPRLDDLEIGLWPIVSSTAINKAVVANEFCMVTAAGVTITLPALPENGNSVAIAVGATTNTLIARNAKTIMGLAENMTIDVANTAIILQYINNDWRLM